MAQQRDILLGRYTIEQMVAQFVIGVVVLLVICDIWTKGKKTAQQRK